MNKNLSEFVFHISFISLEIYKTTKLLTQPFEKQHNMANLPIMDTDSMDTRHGLSTIRQRTHNPLVRDSNPVRGTDFPLNY